MKLMLKEFTGQSGSKVYFDPADVIGIGVQAQGITMVTLCNGGEVWSYLVEGPPEDVADRINKFRLCG